jgi:hypothetical protein
MTEELQKELDLLQTQQNEQERAMQQFKDEMWFKEL